MSEKAITKLIDFEPIKALVLDSVNSEHTRRAYGKALDDFLVWYDVPGKPELSKAVVNRYKVEVLEAAGLSPSTINQRLSAIRKLGQEAADNGLVDQTLANGIANIKGVPSHGVRTGNWLTQDQAQQLLDTLETSTIKALRDRAIVVVTLACGLRRSEIENLTFDHVQQRDGRWAIVDLIGKHNRVRTVLMPAWAKLAIDEWAQAAGIDSGNVFRGVFRYGHTLQPDSKSITSQAVYQAIQDTLSIAYEKTGNPVFLEIAPHDLRRTYARLAREGGSALEQIQLNLGHASVKTTEAYIGTELDLNDAPCDHLGLKL